jgi:glycerophosphoryl diester phosphodiesterase
LSSRLALENWPWRRADRPLVIGHRGVRGDRPENTLAAFEHAGDQGADGIELDVRTCGSGELVVIHDPTLKRVSSGSEARAVAEVMASACRCWWTCSPARAHADCASTWR